MKYFAYGSNMHPARLKARLPNILCISGIFTLPGHTLRFHKVGKDRSAKCDAFYTGNKADHVLGVLYEIDPDDVSEPCP